MRVIEARALNEGRLGRAGNSTRDCCSPVLVRASAPSAQRRPARPSRQLCRQHGKLPRRGECRRTLNEGRLGRAGNSRAAPCRRPAPWGRSTKAGSAEPATLGVLVAAPFLAEQRSTKAGSAEPATQALTMESKTMARDAQRRPARPSRQLVSPTLLRWPQIHALNEGRLGRARQLRGRRRGGGSALRAQRRPARPSRQLSNASLLDRSWTSALNEGRLGRAGNSPGTRDRRPGRGTLNEGRLGRAGNSSRRRRASPTATTLNEGRLGRAGNSPRCRRRRLQLVRRSTKAGSAEPATHP